MINFLKMLNPNLSIVINTFKSEEIIFSCLDSISSNFKVFVIENSDNMELKKSIEQNYSNVECILTGENLGYAKGNNLGLSKVTTKYALVLNPDAKLDTDTLNNFFTFTNEVKEFAMVGPAKQDEFNEKISLQNDKNIFEVDSIKGFAMFLNLDQFKNIGLFDPNFFIYLEEIDLCKRIKKYNKKIYLDKDIKVEHLGGKSHNKSINFEMELSRNWHWMWSTFYFNKKHYGFITSLIKISGKLFSAVLKMIFFILIFNEKKKRIYFHRTSGIINSIFGKSSWYRPKI